MNKHLHQSWIIAWISIGVLLGVVGSLYANEIFGNSAWLIIGLSLSVVSLINRKTYIIVLAVFAGLFIGLYRGSIIYSSQLGYEKHFNEEIVLNGTVSEDVSFSSEGQQRIKIKDVQVNGEQLSGQVWLSSADQTEIKRSDNIYVSGQLKEGFGNFPASIYRADIDKVERTRNADPALEIRDDFAENVRQAVKEPEASLGIGFLTGQHTTLPEGLNNNLMLLGLTHIVVASGYNLTILVRFARRALAKISKYLATFASITMVFSFILVTGISPSMSRAGLITILSVLAWHFGRRIHPFVLLTFSASVTVLINPSYIWGDLGWYLSFAAFAGVMILSPLLLDYFWGKKKPNSLHQVLLETVSAQIATAPIIAYTFSFYAPLAIIANLLILPLIPITMIFTFISGLGAILIGSLSSAIGLPATLTLSYMIEVIDYLASLPFSEGQIDFGLPKLIYSYIILLVTVVYLKRRTKHNFKQDSIIE